MGLCEGRNVISGAIFKCHKIYGKWKCKNQTEKFGSFLSLYIINNNYKTMNIY